MTQQRTGISNRETPEQEARERATHPQTAPDAPPDNAGPEDERVDRQTSNKTGTKSFAQKEDGAKYTDRPMPQTDKKAGAFGKEGSPGTEPESR
jgi:hypothetical protein